MSQPVVVFPDAAAAVTGRLADLLDVPTDVRVPNPRPEEFILVRRVGGTRRDIVTDEATITIEAWAQDEAAAHDLAQLARAYVHAMAGSAEGDVRVYRVGEFAGPASLPDPDSAQSRYTLTVTVAVRGVTPVGS